MQAERWRADPRCAASAEAAQISKNVQANSSLIPVILPLSLSRDGWDRLGAELP
ncbi:hypothetical protein MSC49_00840 [Methylosinus sp. C49]|nr:hypothetical protein MSC49_00840 [Methylosinus sp. C49]